MECVVRVSSRWWGASLRPTLTTAARETSRVYVLQNIEKLINAYIIRNFSVFKLFNLGSLAQRSGHDIV